MDVLIEIVVEQAVTNIIFRAALLLVFGLLVTYISRQMAGEAGRKRNRYKLLGNDHEVERIDLKVQIWSWVIPFVILVLLGLVAVWMT